MQRHQRQKLTTKRVMLVRYRDVGHQPVTDRGSLQVLGIRLMPTPSSTARSQRLPHRPYRRKPAKDPTQISREGLTPPLRDKTNRQQDASSGRHHVGTASDMIPE